MSRQFIYEANRRRRLRLSGKRRGDEEDITAANFVLRIPLKQTWGGEKQLVEVQETFCQQGVHEMIRRILKPMLEIRGNKWEDPVPAAQANLKLIDINAIRRAADKINKPKDADMTLAE